MIYIHIDFFLVTKSYILRLLQPHIFLDRPDGLYSTMEVDSVDAHKYPGLDNVEYQITELHGGDCVLIPYKW